LDLERNDLRALAEIRHNRSLRGRGSIGRLKLRVTEPRPQRSGQLWQRYGRLRILRALPFRGLADPDRRGNAARFL
jgi:hypothetical protein